MHMTKLRRLTAIVGATVLASVPLHLTTTGADASTTPTPSRAATPTITARVTASGVTLTGVKGLHAGRAKLAVKGKGDTTATFGTLRAGYSWEAFTKDLVAGFIKNDAKAIKRVYAKADALGGLAPGESGTIVFPHPGRYFAFTFGDKGPSEPAWFTVGAKRASRTPHVDGRIVATDGPAWSGSASMPAAGTLLFKNVATTKVLHFVEMQRVEEGTTVDEVLATFQGPESQDPPPWMLRGSLSADVLSPGRSMTVDYDLPPGQYVLLCFMPDPNMHGTPHAFMGMIEMIHLT
ncbi:MAG TPA: hypothetical protein VGD39_13180 [Nocardioides sp.]